MAFSIRNHIQFLWSSHSATDNYRAQAQRIGFDLPLTSALICIRLLCIHGFFINLYRARLRIIIRKYLYISEENVVKSIFYGTEVSLNDICDGFLEVKNFLAMAVPFSRRQYTLIRSGRRHRSSFQSAILSAESGTSSQMDGQRRTPRGDWPLQVRCEIDTRSCWDWFPWDGVL
jgi:hypothetical protein